MATKAVSRKKQTPILSPEEGRALFDARARQWLGMSGEEFLRAWEAGAFDGDPDRPEVMHVAMLLPLVK